MSLIPEHKRNTDEHAANQSRQCRELHDNCDDYEYRRNQCQYADVGRSLNELHNLSHRAQICFVVGRIHEAHYCVNNKRNNQ